MARYVAVAVVGLVAPVFVSTPLSAADTRGEAGSRAPVVSMHRK